MVVQHCEYTKGHWIEHFKMVKFMLCGFLSQFNKWETMKDWCVLQHGWTVKTSAEWKKSVTKDHVLYDPISMKCPE